MTRHCLVTLILVNGTLAVTFGIFYQLVKICILLGMSTYLALLATLAGCGFVFWRMRPVRPANNSAYETRNPDSHGEYTPCLFKPMTLRVNF